MLGGDFGKSHCFLSSCDHGHVWVDAWNGCCRLAPAEGEATTGAGRQATHGDREHFGQQGNGTRLVAAPGAPGQSGEMKGGAQVSPPSPWHGQDPKETRPRKPGPRSPKVKGRP